MVQEVERLESELDVAVLVKWKSFDVEKSQFMIPGPITSLRPAVPNVPFGALEYAAVLNHLSIVGSSMAVSALKSRFGRQQLPMLAVSSPAPIVNGNPDPSVTTEVTFQPPITLPSAPLAEVLPVRSERQIVDD